MKISNLTIDGIPIQGINICNIHISDKSIALNTCKSGNQSKRVLKPDSLLFDIWKKSPLPVQYSIYLFNVTNSKEVVKSGADPHLQEVGPYVYEVKQEKENITFNSNGTVSYQQKKTFHFVKDKSSGSLSDIITHLNYVLLGASSVTHHKYADDAFISYAISTAFYDPITDCSLFLKHNVSDLLFKGYGDPMIQSNYASFNYFSFNSLF